MEIAYGWLAELTDNTESWRCEQRRADLLGHRRNVNRDLIVR